MPETAKANRIHPDQEALYVSKGGAYCPFCKSDQIVGGNIDIDGKRSISTSYLLRLRRRMAKTLTPSPAAPLNTTNSTWDRCTRHTQRS